MRALLKLSLLLTVATAWAAMGSRETARSSRAAFAPSAQAWDERDAAAKGDGSRAASGPGTDAAVRSADDLAAEDGTADDGAWVPLVLAAVDGETGVAVEPKEATIEARNPGAPDCDAGALWRSSSRARRGVPAEVEAKVEAPDGYVSDGPCWSESFVSRRAASLRMLAPLRREADLRVRILASDGRPAGRVTEVFMAGDEPVVVPREEGAEEHEEFEIPEEEIGGGSSGSWQSFTVEPANDGWTRIRGVPHLLDERFWIVARDRNREGFAGVILGGFGQRNALEIRLPPQPTRVSTGNYSCICISGG